MMKAWQIRENFELIDRIAISRRTFEELFTHTKERIEFTFNGWDGKSYNGESRVARVYRSNLPGYEDCIFVKVGKALHYIDTEYQVVNKLTGEAHPTAGWLVDVLKGWFPVSCTVSPGKVCVVYFEKSLAIIRL